MRCLRLSQILLFLGICVLLSPALAEDGDSRPVVCFALTIEDMVPTSAPIGGAYRTDLVVLGTGRHDDDGNLRVEVEEVFFGVAPDEGIVLADRSGRLPEGRRIFTLEEATPGGADYSLVFSCCPRTLPATRANIIGARALARARLMEIILSASVVITGTETGYAPTEDLPRWHREEFVRYVKVSRVLEGPEVLAGKIVRVALPGRMTRGGLTLAEGEWIYTAGYRPQSFEFLETPSLLEVRRRLPGALAESVAEILGARDSLPIVEGKRGEVRVIYFPGSVDDAIRVQGSDCEGAAVFAASSLVHRPLEARKPVVDAIRWILFDLDPDATVQHRTLRRLVKVLGRLERIRPAGDVDALIGEWLDHLARSPDAPPPPPPRPPRRRSPSATDRNRSLYWLLQTMEPEHARARYGERLLALRDEVPSSWAQELNLLLERLKLIDAQELPRALERGGKVGCRSSEPGPVLDLGSSTDQVAFNHRGDLLAFDSGNAIEICRVGDWTPVVRIPMKASVGRLAFSPDDRFLYVAGYGGLARYTVPAGELERVYYPGGDRLSDLLVSVDGNTVAALKAQEDAVDFLDAITGALLRSVPTGAYHLTRSPGDDGVLIRGRPTGWRRLPFRGTGQSPLPLSPVPMVTWSARLETSADGRTFVVLNEGVLPPFDESPGSAAIYRWRDGRGERVGEIGLESATMAQYAALSPDGSRLALAGDGNFVRIYAVPDLTLLCSVPFPLPNSLDLSIMSLAFDARGKYLALSLREALPGLIDLMTMERIRPASGHSDEIQRAVLSPDGSTLFTRGRDRTVCQWDMKTLEFVGRVALPPGYEFASRTGLEFARILAAEEGDYDTEWPEGRPAVVLDARTGETISDKPLPPATSIDNVRWLTKDRLLLLSEDGDRIHRHELSPDDLPSTFPVSGASVDRFEVAEDGQTIHVPSYMMKGARGPKTRRIDLVSGEEVSATVPGIDEFRCRQFGLVPGGKWLYFAERGVLILDRVTLAIISHRPLTGIEVGDLVFSVDGRRYAVATSLKNHPVEAARLCPEGTATLVRVHDTATGKTLFAFPVRSYRPRLALGAAGEKLVVVEDDGQLSVRVLPGE